MVSKVSKRTYIRTYYDCWDVLRVEYKVPGFTRVASFRTHKNGFLFGFSFVITIATNENANEFNIKVTKFATIKCHSLPG